MKIDSKESFHKWLTLHTKHPWLRENCEANAITELVDMCKRPVHHELVCDLIDRFVFVDIERRKECLIDIVEQITNHWALPVNETLVAAVTQDNEADSAQYIAHCLRPLFQRKGYDKLRVVNNFGKCCRLKSIAKYQYLVLIDEFIGTGSTMTNKVEQLRKSIKNYMDKGDIKSKNHSINICALACMDQGKRTIESQNVRLFAPILLQKGIAGYCEGKKRFSAYRAIMVMERQLDKSKDNYYILPCGYRKSEALYGMVEGNAVNNLFPVFWWPYSKNDKKRQTMFHRKEA
jgi:hypothetical protein